MASIKSSTEKVGLVVSDRMEKTIVVKVERLIQHAKYKRTIRVSKKYKVHDEANTAHIGDIVRIREVRPLSAQKYHTLVDVVTRAKVSAADVLKEGAQL